VYIATADLMPELHKERHRGKLVLQTISVFLGIIVVYYIVGLFPHAH